MQLLHKDKINDGEAIFSYFPPNHHFYGSHSSVLPVQRQPKRPKRASKVSNVWILLIFREFVAAMFCLGLLFPAIFMARIWERIKRDKHKRLPRGQRRRAKQAQDKQSLMLLPGLCWRFVRYGRWFFYVLGPIVFSSCRGILYRLVCFGTFSMHSCMLASFFRWRWWQESFINCQATQRWLTSLTIYVSGRG